MSKKERAPDHLRFAKEVTRRHGTIFVQSIFYDALQNGSLYDAFHLAGLIEWPDDDERDETPATMRYDRIEDEILRRTLAALERPIADAFIDTAREVIDRERAKQKHEKAERQ